MPRHKFTEPHGPGWDYPVYCEGNIDDARELDAADAGLPWCDDCKEVIGDGCVGVCEWQRERFVSAMEAAAAIAWCASGCACPVCGGRSHDPYAWCCGRTGICAGCWESKACCGGAS